MISQHDIEAFEDMIEDDARTLDEIEQRVTLGVAKHREATTDEWLAVLRCAIVYRDACARMVSDMIGQGEMSMSLHGTGERHPCSKD